VLEWIGADKSARNATMRTRSASVAPVAIGVRRLH